jgi:hypothetical protein
MKLEIHIALHNQLRCDNDTTDVNRIPLIYLVYTKLLYNKLVIYSR